MTRKQILERLAKVGGAPGNGARMGLAPGGARLDARGDHDLNPDMPRTRPLTAAAVLVPLIARGGAMTVLLTKRTDHLTDHAGQISFPGGRIEQGDAGPEAAALRETEEEVGIPADRIDLIGRLDDYETRTGFLVTPVVGFLAAPFPVTPDPFEVADVFEVPLAFVLDPANHQRHCRSYHGTERHFYALPYEGRYIWGATAGMLVNLYEVLRQ